VFQILKNNFYVTKQPEIALDFFRNSLKKNL